MMVYVLWFTLVLGGLFMGGGAIYEQMRSGFDVVLALSAALYLGTAFYSLPPLVRLLRGTK